jgi:hypothetical protein
MQLIFPEEKDNNHGVKLKGVLDSRINEKYVLEVKTQAMKTANHKSRQPFQGPPRR